MYVGISLIREICLTLPLSSGRKVRHSILSFTHSPSDITGHVVVSCRVSRRVVSHYVVSWSHDRCILVSCLFSRHHRWRMHIDSTPKRPAIFRSNLFQTSNTSKIEYIILLYTLQQCDKFFRWSKICRIFKIPHNWSSGSNNWYRIGAQIIATIETIINYRPSLMTKPAFFIFTDSRGLFRVFSNVFFSCFFSRKSQPF